MAEDKKLEKRKNSFFKNYRQMKKRQRAYSFLGILRTTIVVIVLIGFGFLFLSGIINQRKTGETLINYFLSVGQKIGIILNKTAEGEGPVVFTEDGVYLKDADITQKDVLENTFLDVEDVKFNDSELTDETIEESNSDD